MEYMTFIVCFVVICVALIFEIFLIGIGGFRVMLEIGWGCLCIVVGFVVGML